MLWSVFTIKCRRFSSLGSGTVNNWLASMGCFLLVAKGEMKNTSGVTVVGGPISARKRGAE